MKKYFLACILLCGLLPSLSAQKKKIARHKHEQTIKAKKKGAGISVSKSSRKKNFSKKNTAGKTRHGRYAEIASAKKHGVIHRKTTEWHALSTLNLSSEDAIFGNGLVSNRGKLPWPVDGTVSIPFGEYNIEGTRIRGMNPGITIITPDKDVPVKAVYDGVVCNIDSIGEVSSIYIRHGKYYTVYSNVSAIHVSKGEVVKAGDIIGNVGEAYETSGGELNFLVMEDKNNVDPSRWLSRSN